MTNQEPIPVSDAIAALEHAIKVCDAATQVEWHSCKKVDNLIEIGNGLVGSFATVADWRMGEPGPDASANAAFIVHARACYRGTLECLKALLDGFNPTFELEKDVDRLYYAAVSPIVERWKAEVKR